MNDEEQTDIDTPEQTEQPAAPTERKVVLNDAPIGRAGSPVLWLLFLTVPIVIALWLSADREPPPDNFQALAVEREAFLKQQAAKVLEHPVDNTKQAPPKPKAVKVKCNFAPWVGLKLSDKMLGIVKKANRPYRVLSPNTEATDNYIRERVNFRVDESNMITAIDCG